MRSLLLGLVIGAASGCQVFGFVRPAEVRIRVLDEDGNPLEGARINASFQAWARDEPGLEDLDHVVRRTDRDGRAMLAGRSGHGVVPFSVRMDGYYRHVGDARLDGATATGLLTPRQGEIEVTLYRRGNGIRREWKSLREMRFPMEGEFVGFDFKAGDWVAPHGRGQVADVEMKVEYVDLEVPEEILERQPGLGRNQHRFEARFPEGAGIQVHYAHPRRGSDLKFPREAPRDGYQRTLVYESTWYLTDQGVAGVRRTSDLDREDVNYLIRFRPMFDEEGNVVSVHYGGVAGQLAMSDTLGRAALLRYFYNPTPSDRTLEARPPPPPTSPRPPPRGPAFEP